MLRISGVLLIAGIGALAASRYQLFGTFHSGRMIWFVFLVLSIGFFLADLILKLRADRT